MNTQDTPIENENAKNKRTKFQSRNMTPEGCVEEGVRESVWDSVCESMCEGEWEGTRDDVWEDVWVGMRDGVRGIRWGRVLEYVRFYVIG